MNKTKITTCRNIASGQLMQLAFVEEFGLILETEEDAKGVHLYLPCPILPTEMLVYVGFASGVQAVLEERDNELVAMLKGIGAGLVRGGSIHPCGATVPNVPVPLFAKGR